MMQLQNFIGEAVQMGAREIRIRSDFKPQLRQGKIWKNLSESPSHSKWVRENFFSILTEADKQTLSETGNVAGILQMQFQKSITAVEFSISCTLDGLHGHFCWNSEPILLEDYGLPQSVIESWSKAQGLSLIGGGRRCGKTSFLRVLSQHLQETGSAIAVFADEPAHYAGTGAVQFDLEKLTQMSQLLRGIDVVIIDTLKPLAWRTALSLAESGQRILLSVPYMDLENSIYRLAERLDSVAGTGLARVSANLQVALSIKLIDGIVNAKQPVFELLLATPEIRKDIQGQKWDKVQKAMYSMGEKTGMRTLNQCLMNLMLKRKIDFRVGFSESPAPQELDLMLEKVGV